MSAPILEAFLARIYVDPQARERFLNNPTAEALGAGLSDEEVEAVKQIDQAGLELFAASLERKRQSRVPKRKHYLLGFSRRKNPVRAAIPRGTKNTPANR